MKNSGIIILIIILVIILGIAIGIIDSGNEPQNNDVLNKIENVDNNQINNEQENNNINEELVNEENNVIVNETVSSETFQEEPETEQEKAINIVKTDWNGSGNNQNVKFTADGMDASGRYIISVRDKDTTEALAFYTVNVSDKTFTKREMN